MLLQPSEGEQHCSQDRGHEQGQDEERNNTEDPDYQEQAHMEGTCLAVRDLPCVHLFCRCIRIVDTIDRHGQAGDDEERTADNRSAEDEKTPADIPVVYLPHAGEEEAAERCKAGALLGAPPEPDPAPRADLSVWADEFVSTFRTEV